MVDRKSDGDPIDRLSARTWNSFIDAAEAHKRRRVATPVRQRAKHRQTDIVYVRNDSSETRLKGEVLELNGYFLLDQVDDDYLWLSGTATAGGNFGILKQPAAVGDIRPLQVSGACRAWVNIRDLSHDRASAEAGEPKLQSDSHGEMRILHRPEATGEQECVVLFDHPLSQRLIWFRVEDSGSNRLDPGGSATAFRQEWSGSAYQTPGGSPSAETIYDISDASAFFGQNFVLPGELVPCMQSSISGRLECVGSRGLRRECIVTETGGIAIGGSGEVTIRQDESTAAGETVTAANWDFIDEAALEEDNEAIVEFWPDRGEWVVVDRNC